MADTFKCPGDLLLQEDGVPNEKNRTVVDLWNRRVLVVLWAGGGCPRRSTNLTPRQRSTGWPQPSAECILRQRTGDSCVSPARRIEPLEPENQSERQIEAANRTPAPGAAEIPSACRVKGNGVSGLSAGCLSSVTLRSSKRARAAQLAPTGRKPSDPRGSTIRTQRRPPRTQNKGSELLFCENRSDPTWQLFSPWLAIDGLGGPSYHFRNY